ncbi:MAG: hypothetical protein IJH12_02860 [Clostridia bacterium]|nr:hypothetical protein [Clostridia bacterium]
MDNHEFLAEAFRGYQKKIDQFVHFFGTDMESIIERMPYVHAREVLTGIYEEKKSLRQIGREVGISPTRVREIKRQAYRKVREILWDAEAEERAMNERISELRDEYGF